MFKMFSTMTLFGLLTISAAYGGSSQTLKADIPFAFMVRNTTLAAGNYQLTYRHAVTPRFRSRIKSELGQ